MQDYARGAHRASKPARHALRAFGYEVPSQASASGVAEGPLLGRPGATLQGGGVYLDGFELTRAMSVIAHNHPDQCFGGDTSATARRTAPLRSARPATIAAHVTASCAVAARTDAIARQRPRSTVCASIRQANHTPGNPMAIATK